MNEHDKNNYEFLMKSNKATLSEWFESITDDDIKYAFELLKTAQVAVDMELAELLDRVDHTDDADYAILEILSKFDNK